MKQFYLKVLQLCLLCMTGATAFAYDCEVDGIYYNLNENEMTAEVTYKEKSISGGYSGDVVIPASIICSDQTYSVTGIGNKAFLGCSGLISINIPNSVTGIGNSAFFGCSGLISINIPNSVTGIGENAFYGCTGLISVISQIQNPFPITKGFDASGYNGYEEDYIYKQATLYVPEGKASEYAATEGWKKFQTIKEGVPEGIQTVFDNQLNVGGKTCYDLRGRQLSAPQPGLNIVRYSDGTTKKVFVK